MSDTPLDVTIFDANLGRAQQTVKVMKSGNSFSAKLDLTQLPVGTYIVEIQQDGERVHQKILKAE